MNLSCLIAFIILFQACLYSIEATSTYKVISKNMNSTSIFLQLEYIGTEDYYLKPTSPHIKQLNFLLYIQSFNDFYFKITDSQKQRFEIPEGGIFPQDPFQNFSFPLSNCAVNFTYTENPFDFKLIRKSNGAVIFSTYEQSIVYSDYYLQIGSEVESEYVYGIGERFEATFRKGEGKWTVFNRDRGENIDKGMGLQTYGYYPFYLIKENHYFHINYFRSSNAMDIITEQKAGKTYLTFKVIGGILDFRFFLGEANPELLIQKFNLYFGRSEIPPFWSFGFHQSRWGYKNVTYLEEVIQNYKANDLPLDTIWSDIDYLINNEVFTIDEIKFPLDRMKNITNNIKYIPIIDAGIKMSGFFYQEGLRRNVFTRDATGRSPFIGRGRPGNISFVDFFHPNASKYWQDMLSILYNKVQFSGIWLDMNEVSNYCDGPCFSTNETSFDYTNDLPYQPGADVIESDTISLNCSHYPNISQANVHAYFALLETSATNQFLKSKSMKPFILSRSSTFGSNRYGFHWSGDNEASWQFLRVSIIDTFNNQLWGNQMTGADICGFTGNTTEQLCARWLQLGVLYPFSRSHNNGIKFINQEPYALGKTVLKCAHNNLKLRYSLLKHYYSLFLRKKGVGTIIKPLFIQFPNDLRTYDQQMDTQFLIGSNLLAAPIVEEGAIHRNLYFPQVSWYNLHNGEQYLSGESSINNIGLVDKVPLFLREGTLILMQDTTIVTKTQHLNNRFIANAGFALNSEQTTLKMKVYESTGSISSIKDYNDDSIIELCLKDSCEYNLYLKLSVIENTLSLQLTVLYFGGLRLNEQIFLDELRLFYENKTIVKKLDKSIEIRGNMKINIAMDNNFELERQIQ